LGEIDREFCQGMRNFQSIEQADRRAVGMPSSEQTNGGTMIMRGGRAR
jgi:hypothetical protein